MSTTVNGRLETRDKGLKIGGHESLWLADLVAAFVLEKLDYLFNKAVYNGIYRDNGLVIMDGVKFQKRVNLVTCYEL
jgi:hypothetical protein